MRCPRSAELLVTTALVVGFLPCRAAAGTVRFTDVTASAGAAYLHRYTAGSVDSINRVAGGAAAGDYDGDGWIDIYGVAGIDGNRLLRNLQDGTFADVTDAVGVRLDDRSSSGPSFADYDGDGLLDLFVGPAEGARPMLFQNRGDGRLEPQPSLTAIFRISPYTSSSFGDYDRDGDLDLFTTHWGTLLLDEDIDHLWRNNGDGTFTAATAAANLTIKRDEIQRFLVYWSFSGSFSDIDNDGWLDLLLSSDYERSQVFLNNRDGTFSDVTTPVISDENGMGTAIGDYDNDGDLDWFVSSVFDDSGIPSDQWGSTGNRLYRNRGDGLFEDATDEAGVRDGNWGWGSCFADFDNDGFLDIFHVNGWEIEPRFTDQPARLFMSNRDGTFSEQAEAAGVDDRGSGRGVICFDYDRDGDIDVFIANNGGSSKLFRNDSGNSAPFLHVELIGRPPNTQGIGARISVTTGSGTEIRELRAGCNYVSQDPPEAHFGLGEQNLVGELRVRWPDGAETVRHDVVANQFLRIARDPGDANCDGRLGAADLVRGIALNAAPPQPYRCPLADVDENGIVDDNDRRALIQAAFGD